MTLLPGTVILTGTPEGVGFTRQPPVYLQAGDLITVDIEGIGQLSNPVRMEESVVHKQDP
jgi:2-keto-4-pentenoate hydratase/2-oxohepta-3-ene-1,7-dioic acid hydratase in catechol pathway